MSMVIDEPDPSLWGAARAVTEILGPSKVLRARKDARYAASLVIEGLNRLGYLRPGLDCGCHPAVSLTYLSCPFCGKAGTLND